MTFIHANAMKNMQYCQMRITNTSKGRIMKSQPTTFVVIVIVNGVLLHGALDNIPQSTLIKNLGVVKKNENQQNLQYSSGISA
jgi:hypothetical protein